MATVLEIAKKMNKEYEDNNLLTKSSIVPYYKRLSCDAFGFNYPLYGGIPYGRITVFSGKEHSGKTLMAVLQMAAYQKENPDKLCVFVDVEHSLDMKFAVAMTGLDTDKMLYMNPTTLSGEQVLNVILELQQSDDIGMIVLDSIPALNPSINLENDMEKDTGMRGTIAKSLHRFLNTMTPLLNRKNNILLMINQVRIAGTSFTGAPIYSEPGGSAPSYLASVKVRFGTRTFTKEDNMDCCKPDGAGADGFRLKFQITKCKTSPCDRGGGFATFRYLTGLDSLHDVIEIALTYGFIVRVNNVRYQLVNLETGEVYLDENGVPLDGKKANLIEYLDTHEEFKKQYIDMLVKHISASNDIKLLSKEELDEIKAEEAAVENSSDIKAAERIISDEE